MVTVDVTLGPLLTFSAFNLKKGWPHLRRDLAVIGLLQLAGLAYGLHTMFVARPVAAVLEVDRFRVISALGVYEQENDALMTALEKGYDVGQRPGFWEPYEHGRGAALKAARPIRLLLDRYPTRAGEFNAALAARGLPADGARFLPVVARGDWVAVLDKTGDIAIFLAADGFF